MTYLDANIEPIIVTGSLEHEPSAMSDELARHTMAGPGPTSDSISAHGLSLVRASQDELFGTDHLDNDPTEQSIMKILMTKEECNRDKFLALMNDAKVVEHYLRERRLRGDHIVMDLTQLNCDVRAFEWVLEYLRSLRRYQGGLLPRPDKVNPTLPQRAKVLDLAKLLALPLTNYE